MEKIKADMLIKDVVADHPETVGVFANHGLPCTGCQLAAAETVAQGAAGHHIAVGPLLEDLNLVAEGKEPVHRKEPSTAPVPPPGKVEKEGIRRVVAVMSGKGGVGKSLVTGLCALASSRAGLRTGILDGDITGPSIPKMFGLGVGANGMDEIPASTKTGIKVVSMNLLLTDENQPVIWRGPLISGAMRQFFTDLDWGEIDYLWVDLPPGTSDAPLTALQSLPLDGVVMVATPQALAGMVVKKAINLVQQMGVPILGVVENMSYLELPGGGRAEPFGPSRAYDLVMGAAAPLLARLPLDPNVAALCDAGKIEDYRTAATNEFAENLLEALGEKGHDGMLRAAR